MSNKKKTRPRQLKKKSSALLQPARLDKDKLRLLYSSMLRCRMLTLRLQDLQNKDLEEHEGQRHPNAPHLGSEAVPAGILLDLQPEDRIAPGIHWQAARLVRGESPKSIIAGALGVRRPGLSSDHKLDGIAPLDFPQLGQISLVLGAAWSFKSRQDQHLAVVFYGSAVDPDLLRDAVGFSVHHKLDVVHVVEVGGGVPRLGSEYPDLPVLTVDGDDAVAVYRVGQEALRRARQGRGPALIECLTTALATLSTRANFAFSAPPPSDDPIARLEVYLRQRGFWSESWSRGLAASFSRELDRAVESAQKLIPRVLPDETDASLLASTG